MSSISRTKNDSQLSPRLSQHEIAQFMQRAKNDPEHEVMELHREKELLIDAYANIDVDNNGDIELGEFLNGMRAFGVELNEQQLQKVFVLMDSDTSGFIDKNDFVLFLTQKFTAQSLIELQQAVLAKVNGIDNLKHEAQEMRELLMGLVQDEVQVQNKEDKLHSQIEMQQELNPDFGKQELCQQWTIFEVAHWLQGIGLEQYCQPFMQTAIDGRGLLYDLSEETLSFEMGVKRVHVAKLLRAIDTLRQFVVKQWDESEFIEHCYVPAESCAERVSQMQAELQFAQNELQVNKEEMQQRMDNLLAALQEKTLVIQNAEAQGFVGTIEEDNSLPSLDDFEVEMIDQVPEFDTRSTMSTQNTVVFHDRRISQFEARQSEIVDSGGLYGTPLDENGITPVPLAVAMSMSVSPVSEMSTQTYSFAQPQHHHHRKKSSKAFWGNKKRPPTGTKAYWLFLEHVKENNPSFGAPKRVMQWHHHEVAHWLKSVKCDKYATQFVEEKVSGETLVKDMTPEVLNSDLSVKMLHCSKMMREIRALRITAKLEYEICHGKDISIPSYATSNNPQQQIKTQQKTIQQEQQKYRELVQTMNREQQKLKVEIEQLERQVVRLESGGADELKDDEIDLGLDIIRRSSEREGIKNTKPEPFDKSRYPKQVCRVMEIIRRQAKYEKGFGEPQRANKWSLPEVLLWLDSIEFPSYIASFLRNQIDGEILIRDLNADILHEDLGVKRFHTGKMIREIRRLRGITGEALHIVDNEQFNYAPKISALLKKKKKHSRSGSRRKSRSRSKRSRNFIEQAQMDERANKRRYRSGSSRVKYEQHKHLGAIDENTVLPGLEGEQFFNVLSMCPI